MHPRTMIQLTLQIIKTPERENTLPASFVRSQLYNVLSPKLTMKAGSVTSSSSPQCLPPRFHQRQYPLGYNTHFNSLGRLSFGRPLY